MIWWIDCYQKSRIIRATKAHGPSFDQAGSAFRWCPIVINSETTFNQRTTRKAGLTYQWYEEVKTLSELAYARWEQGHLLCGPDFCHKNMRYEPTWSCSLGATDDARCEYLPKGWSERSGFAKKSNCESFMRFWPSLAAGADNVPPEPACYTLADATEPKPSYYSVDDPLASALGRSYVVLSLRPGWTLLAAMTPPTLLVAASSRVY